MDDLQPHRSWLSIKTKRRRESAAESMPLTHAPIVPASRELNNEIKTFCLNSRHLHKNHLIDPRRSLELHMADIGFIFNLCILYSPDTHTHTHTHTHNAMYWKIKRTSPHDILLLTHYIMRSHFFFCTYARVHACTAGAPWAACLRHVLCVCVCVCVLW